MKKKGFFLWIQTLDLEGFFEQASPNGQGMWLLQDVEDVIIQNKLQLENGGEPMLQSLLKDALTTTCWSPLGGTKIFVNFWKNQPH